MVDMILHAGRKALYLAQSMELTEVWGALQSDERQVLACCALIVVSLAVIAVVILVDRAQQAAYLRTRDAEAEHREQLELHKEQWQRAHERREAQRRQNGGAR